MIKLFVISVVPSRLSFISGRGHSKLFCAEWVQAVTLAR